MSQIDLTPEEVELVRDFCVLALSSGELLDYQLIAGILLKKLEAIKPEYNPTKEDIWAAVLMASR